MKMRRSNAVMRLATILGVFLALSGWAATVSDSALPAGAKIQAMLGRVEPVKALGQSATKLSDGSWLLAGGLDENGRVSDRLVLLDEHRRPLPAIAAKLANARTHHTGTALADGSVLFIGGVNAQRQPIAALERFRPDTSEIEVVGDVGVDARSQHSATLLTDGRVLIAGGVDVSALVRGDAQLLDPRAWRVESVPQQMIDRRFGHGASLLSSDDVLLWNGRDQNQSQVDSVELFQRGSSQFARVDALDSVLRQPYSSVAPRVVGTLPRENASDVALDPQLAVRFSKPLSVRTLNKDSVTLLGPSGALEARVVSAEAGQLLFVTPERQLLPGTSYTLFIKAATDDAGQVLPFTALGFTTRTFALPQRPVVQQPTREREEERLSDADGELWVPGAHNLSGAWRSGNGHKMPKQMPKRAALTKAIYGKQVKDTANTVPKGVTALAGQVLKLNSAPLGNVTLSIDDQTVTTDANGEFVLTRIPSGTQTLVIDGGTADRGRRQYGRYEYRAVIEANKVNVLPFVIWMTRLDSENDMTVPSPTPAEFVLTNPRIPGLELHVPKDTVIRDAQGKVVTEISMTAIPVDQPPFPLPNSFVPVYFTVQPGGAHLQGLSAQASKGARLIYPNYSKARPGERMDFWNYDSRDKGWYVYGQGAVSADGKQIVPDEGVVIYEFSGAMIALPSEAPPNGPPGGGSSCGAGGGGGPPPPASSGPSQAGDPVDCYTGLFLHRRVDLQVADVIPLEVLRTYRPNDAASRTFGIGATLGYDIFLVGDLNPYTYQELILPDGARIRYVRTSPGTSWTDAVYVSTTSPGEFFGSTLRWDTASGSGWILRLKNGTEYSFPEAAMLSARCNAPRSMRDRNGNTLTFTRGTGCRLTTVMSPHGRRLNFSYDASNRVTQLIDEIGRAVIYQYDTSGRLTTVTYPDNTTESYTYDANHRMLTVTDRRGNPMVTNVYDSNGRVSQQTYADSTTSSFVYTLNSSNAVTQTDYTDERGTVRRVQFHSSGLPISITDALGRPEQKTVSFARDSSTNLVQTRTDAMGRVTAYQYDAKGNIMQRTYLHGTNDATTWQYSYEPNFSQVASITDPLNHSRQHRYDEAGNLTSSTDALNHEVSYTYVSDGRVATISRSLGGASLTTTYTYNGADIAGISDPLGRQTLFFSDRVGRIVTVKDPVGNIERFAYNSSDRITEVTDGAGQRISYLHDANGNLTTFEDPRGNVTSYAYDARNRLSSKTDPLIEVESYLYDDIGNLTRVTDRKGQVSGYVYDALSRLASAGFGATTTSPTAYASTVAYTWDAGDRLTDVVDSVSGLIEREFDGLDRLIQEQSAQGQIGYTYNANDLRKTMTVQGQPSVNYTYDDADRLTQISQGSATVGFTYDSMDRRTTLTLPSGIDVLSGYDDAGQLTSLVYRNGSSTLGDITYGYDATGRRISVGGTFARVNLPAPVASTAHDVANRLTNWGGRILGYDDNGALVTNSAPSVESYVWDERQRLKEIKQGSVTVASFQYDAFNRRTGKTVNGTTTSFLNDENQVVQELSGAIPVANLLTGLEIDEIFRRTAGATIEDFLVDHLGSIIALTDAAGVIHATYAYEPYGETSGSGSPSTNAYQYTGREYDMDGLYYYRFRYYSPSLQRFLSEDPIGFQGGNNLYAYAKGDPVSYSDPYGLDRKRYRRPPGQRPRKGHFLKPRDCDFQQDMQCRSRCATRGGMKDCWQDQTFKWVETLQKNGVVLRKGEWRDQGGFTCLCNRDEDDEPTSCPRP